MSGIRGGSPQMVEGDHEVDPSLARKLGYLSGVLTVLGLATVLVWSVLARVDGAVTDYVSGHPGVLWALSVLLLAGLAAHTAGREYGRRDEAARTSTWRAARTSRADSAVGAADCRKCSVLRSENAVLQGENVALKAEIEAIRSVVTTGTGALPIQRPEVVDVIEVVEVLEVLDRPASPELRETT